MSAVTPRSAWTPEAAAHLLSRAGFGGSPEDVERLHSAGPERAVEALLEGAEDSADFPAPEWAKPTDFRGFRMEMRSLDQEQRQMKARERRREQNQNMGDLVSWWTWRMRYTSHPLREKMTLFWHGHFATSYIKVRDAYLIYQQNETFRKHALGNFEEMTKAVSKDPAMIRWLDTDKSKKEMPNENFARELFELFTLGEGNYSEDDIRESARAFTGYRISPATQEFAFSENQHDSGEKLIFGRRGKWTGDDVVEMAVARPASAPFITGKIWRFLAGEEAPMEPVVRFAKEFQASRYDIRQLLQTIFTSAEFYSDAVMGKQIKSPVQWLVQSNRQLDSTLPQVRVQRRVFQDLGQIPFFPPNVAGWDGGRSWINASTLLARYNHSVDLLGRSRREQRELMRLVPEADRKDSEAVVKALEGRLFLIDIPEADHEKFVAFAREKNAGTDPDAFADLVRLMMSTPAFQLT